MSTPTHTLYDDLYSIHAPLRRGQRPAGVPGQKLAGPDSYRQLQGQPFTDDTSFHLFVDLDLLGTAPSNARQRRYLSFVRTLLKSFPGARVVGCTDWALADTTCLMPSLLVEDLRVRVSGVTPLLREFAHRRGQRQREIERWLDMRGLSNSPWIALDSYAFGFDEGLRRRIDPLQRARLSHARLFDQVRLELRAQTTP